MPFKSNDLLLIVLSYALFVVLGLPAGYMGAAWPSIRGDFALPLDALGVYLLVTTTGYTLASFFNAQISSRLGFSGTLLAAVILNFAGLLAKALAPQWIWLVLFCLATGLGGGTLDAILNRYMAARPSALLMNWLHASYGIGAMLGPLLLSGLLGAGLSWRWGFGGIAALQAALAVGVLVTFSRWQKSTAAEEAAPLVGQAEKAPLAETLRLAIVWLGLALFFLYAGSEETAGQWVYSLFTLGRGFDPAAAGWWTSFYWASFTLGRLGLGFLADRLGPARMLRLCLLGALLGALLLWWNPLPAVSFAGLALVGFSFAPLFPTMISLTPRLVGARHAANAIGMQVGTASLGIAALPWLAGFLASGLGLEVIGPFLAALVAVMAGLFWRLLRTAKI